jgi:hypothetical protein
LKGFCANGAVATDEQPDPQRPIRGRDGPRERVLDLPEQANELEVSGRSTEPMQMALE